MDGAQFRNVVGFLLRPTTTDRRVDAMGHQAQSSQRAKRFRLILSKRRTRLRSAYGHWGLQREAPHATKWPQTRC